MNSSNRSKREPKKANNENFPKYFQTFKFWSLSSFSDSIHNVINYLLNGLQMMKNIQPRLGSQVKTM